MLSFVDFDFVHHLLNVGDQLGQLFGLCLQVIRSDIAGQGHHAFVPIFRDADVAELVVAAERCLDGLFFVQMGRGVVTTRDGQ